MNSPKHGATELGARISADSTSAGQDQENLMARNNGHSEIQGWGADLDRSNRPAVPMERTPPRLQGVHWKQPAQQARKVTVFHSTERPGITPVFGTSVPPKGVSGYLRKIAFKRSENDIRHWMLLLLADRINVVEGMIEDAGESPRGVVASGAALGMLAGLMFGRRSRY
jgi:hypothetical protein